MKLEAGVSLQALGASDPCEVRQVVQFDVSTCRSHVGSGTSHIGKCWCSNQRLVAHPGQAKFHGSRKRCGPHKDDQRSGESSVSFLRRPLGSSCITFRGIELAQAHHHSRRSGRCSELSCPLLNRRPSNAVLGTLARPQSFRSTYRKDCLFFRGTAQPSHREKKKRVPSAMSSVRFGASWRTDKSWPMKSPALPRGLFTPSTESR